MIGEGGANQDYWKRIDGILDIVCERGEGKMISRL